MWACSLRRLPWHTRLLCHGQCHCPPLHIESFCAKLKRLYNCTLTKPDPTLSCHFTLLHSTSLPIAWRLAAQGMPLPIGMFSLMPPTGIHSSQLAQHTVNIQGCGTEVGASVLAHTRT
jgi:hypothetical protein